MKLIPDSQFRFPQGLGNCDDLLTLNHDLQSSLDLGHEYGVVVIDFNSLLAVNHRVLIYKLQLFSIDRRLLSIFYDFSTNRTQCVVVDGACSVSVPVVSGFSQDNVLGSLFFSIFVFKRISASQVLGDCYSEVSFWCSPILLYLFRFL